MAPKSSKFSTHDEIHSPAPSRVSAATHDNKIMPRKSNLLAALDAHKGRDYKLEKQKGLQKKAEKRRKSKAAVQTTAGDSVATPATENSETVPQREEGSKGWESEESEDAVTSVSLAA